MSQIEVDRGGFQSYFGYVSDDAGETFSQTFTATGSAITHLTFPVDLDTSSTATMRVLIADVTGGAIGAILYDSGTISIAPIPGESLGYGGGPFRDVNLDMNVTTIPGHQYVILFDGLPDADGSDRIVLGWNPDSTYGGGTAGYWFADPSVGLSFASNNTLQGDYAFTMTFSDTNVINGTPDDDFLVGTNGDDTINAFAGNDVVNGLAGNDTIDGGDDHDLLNGQQGNDTIYGGNGDDLIRPGTGDDFADGGAGLDRVSYASVGSDALAGGVTVSLALQGTWQNTGGGGTDFLVGFEHLTGTRFDDTLTGDGGNNWLWGGSDPTTGVAGNDTISGGGGNDLIQIGLGNSLVDGGTGTDTLTFFGDDIGVPTGVTFSLALQGGVQGTSFGNVTAMNFENLSGTIFGDTLSGDGNDNVLAGDAGNDTLNGGAGADTLYGDGAITVDTHDLGYSGPITTIADTGAGGNDTLEGGAGNDTLDGGGGSDTASYEHNAGHVEAFLSGSTGSADEYDAAGNYLSTDFLQNIENLTGSAFDDVLVGNSGDNLIQGLGGNDTILGQAGNDTLEGGDGSDIMRGDTATSVGNDVLIGGAGDDHMRGGAGVDSFDGGSDDGGESIYGGIGDRISFFEVAATAGVVADLRTGVISNDGFGNVESMTGIESLGGDTAYVDTFYGNDGRNTLLGGRGDHLCGFGGDDNFSMAAAAASVDGGTGTDTLQVNSAGGWLMPDTNSDGIAEAAAAATEGWFINLLAGNMFDGYGNFGTVTGIENVDGSELDDTIRGDNGNNVINGEGGNDFILGMGGDDTIIGGDGNDNLRGDNQLYTGGPFGNDILIGGAGDDLMRGGPGVDSFDGGSDTGTVNNNFTGYGDRVSFYEPAATAGAVADLRTGIISNDGYGNVESMVGVESLGGDTAFADTFYGNDGTNFMFADLGDSVYGFGGDDIFQLASAAALADGGDGIDRLTLTSSGGWLMMDTNSDGIAETADAALAGWTVDLSAGTLIDGYGNSGSVTGFENVDGSELGDTLIGDGNANVLNGLDGNDTLEGRGGDDTLDGGNGSDTASYEHAVGPVEVYLGSEAFEYAADGLTLVGHDTLISIENATGSAFDDFLFGDGNANVLNGLGGNDDLLGGGGDDTLIGGAGEDTADYTGAAGAVTVDLTAGTATGDGNDTLIGIEDVFGSGAGDHLIGDGGNNQLFGFGGADVIEGMAGNDTLRGMGGNDTLLGGIGNDFLNGGIGDDTIDGGAGFDRATFFSGATAGVHVDLNLQGVAQNTGQGMDTLLNIENVSGTVFGDTLIGDNNNNWLWGSPSTDSLTGIVAATNNDTLDGGGGNDLLMVGIGNHSLTGGTGTDTVAFTENGSPEPGLTISLALQGVAQATGAGNWTLNGIENLSGGINNDTLTGDGNANVLAGDQGNDTLVGGGGNDTLYGDGRIAIDYAGGPGTSGPIATFADGATADPAFVDGNDTLDGGAGDDILNGGGGIDTASFASWTEGVIAGLNNVGGGFATNMAETENDTLISIENLSGSAFNDQLLGNASDNVLSGGDGDDLIFGRGGNDTLIGGNGNDFFRNGVGNDVIDGGAGFDRVSSYGSGLTTGVHVDLNLQGVAQDTGHGMDTLTGIEALSGTDFDDTLIGDGNDNWLIAADGNDTLIGNGGNDLLTATDGELAPTDHSHVMDGGTGNDTAGFTGLALDPDGVTVSLALQGAAQDTGHGMMTLSNFENLSGSTHDDRLTGDGNNNILSGDAGNDTLVGGAGNDTLYGDGALVADTRASGGGSGPITFFSDVAAFDPSLIDGNDTLEGGLGNDTLNGGGGSDTASYAHATGDVQATISAGGGGSSSGADGNDTFVSIENLTGGAFNDQLVGNGGANVLDGGDGHDALRGGGGNDTLLGGTGDDFLNGNVGDDTIDGGAGWDRATFATGAVAGVTVDLNLQGIAQNTGQGMDTLLNIEHVSGTSFNDTLTGNGGDNWIWGQGGNDVLIGNGGNDLIQAGAPGNLTADGGSGTDTLSLNNNDAGGASVTVSLALQGVAQATGIGTYTLTGFENLSGSSGNDTLTGDGGANVLAGSEGNDTLVGGAGNDTLYGDGQVGVDAHGTGGSGPITTYADVATLGGVDGDDTFEGGLGNDTLNGGGGSDTATYAHASGSVTVNLGTGTASGADGNDTLVSIENVIGSLFADTITGDANANTLNGNDGNDTLDGRAGNDTLNGGNGTDTASYANASGSVTVDLTTGTASGADGSDTLSSIENVTGSLFADTITGSAGANVLNGNDGNDTLDGRAGNDTLNGGNGMDTASYANASGSVTINLNIGNASGADGADTLTSIENAIGSAFADTITGDANANSINGGDGNDTILGGKGDDWLYGGRGNDTLTGQQGNDRFVIEASSGNDHVTDFAIGSDKVQFSGIAGVDDFTDLTLTKVGSNTVITWGTGDSLTLDGLKPSQLHASDFEFSASAAAASTLDVSLSAMGTDFQATSFGSGAFEQGVFLHEAPGII